MINKAKLKARRDRWTYSEKGKLFWKKYTKTKKWKDIQRKYRKSKKGHIVRLRKQEKAKQISDLSYIKYNGHAKNLRDRYGMSVDDYNRMLVEQKGVCAICECPEMRKKTHRSGRVRLNPLCVDHNHVTGKVRGLLCQNCNNGISRFEENIEHMANAISYLEKHKAPAEAVMAGEG